MPKARRIVFAEAAQLALDVRIAQSSNNLFVKFVCKDNCGFVINIRKHSKLPGVNCLALKPHSSKCTGKSRDRAPRAEHVMDDSSGTLL